MKFGFLMMQTKSTLLPCPGHRIRG